MSQFSPSDRRTIPARITLRFIALSVGLSLLAGGAAGLLARYFPFQPQPGEVVFPPAFWWTTVLIGLGSVALEVAVASVRRERQVPFRQALVAAMIVGSLFVALQSYGLICLIRNQVPDDAQTGANAFITMLAGLHGMHFVLALMFLTWITLCAFADRYDHEYFWGVTLCAWFWHGLGIVWVLILVVFSIATPLRSGMGNKNLHPRRPPERIDQASLSARRSCTPESLFGVRSNRTIPLLPAHVGAITNRAALERPGRLIGGGSADVV